MTTFWHVTEIIVIVLMAYVFIDEVRRIIRSVREIRAHRHALTQTIFDSRGKHEFVPATSAWLRVLTRNGRFYVAPEILGGPHDGELLPIKLDALILATIDDIDDITSDDGAEFRLAADNHGRIHATQTKEEA